LALLNVGYKLKRNYKLRLCNYWRKNINFLKVELMQIMGIMWYILI